MKLNGVQKTIYWDILFLLLLGTLGINAKWFFVFAVIYYAYLLLKNRGKMYFPKVWGLKLYLLFILYGTILGLMLYPVRNVLRDLYYVLPTLTWIFIGYHLRMKNQGSNKCLITTLSIYGVIVSASCMVKFLFQATLDFDNFRTIFGVGVYEVGFILPIVIMESLVFQKVIVSKAWDKVIIIIMTLQIVLSFGRIAILEPIIMLCVLVVFLAIYKKEHRKIAVRIMGVIGGLFVLLLVVYSFMPERVTKIFIDKVLYSAEEVDMSQEITSTSDAMSNWRVYEMQAAREQWSEGNILDKIFGSGIGKGVSIKYIPHGWSSIVDGNEIPLLHNGFLTLLPKGGIIAVFALCLLVLGNAIKGFKIIYRNKTLENKGIILIGISVAAVATTYVARGPVQQGAFLAWGLLIGWLNADVELG